MGVIIMWWMFGMEEVVCVVMYEMDGLSFVWEDGLFIVVMKVIGDLDL